ncbi:hypothetical protein [Paenibacillus wenxiniae]|uniref:Uncharacterized protein n=1 Tax=Paenibacillus wenxiniae TaxID=1636843 RepID=A0ABW4RKW9_9BACL
MMLTIRGQQTLTVTYTLHFARKGGPEEMKTINLYWSSFIQLQQNLSNAERNPRPEEQTLFEHHPMQIETTDHSNRIFAATYRYAF